MCLGLAIAIFGGSEGHFSLAIIAFGALQFIALRLLNALNSEDMGFEGAFFPCDDSL